MIIPRGLEVDPIWVKYYEMFQCYLELKELEKEKIGFTPDASRTG